MYRFAASAGALDVGAQDKTSLVDLFDTRAIVGSGSVGLSSFFRRPEVAHAGLVIRRGEASSVVRVDRVVPPSPGMGFSTTDQHARLENVPSLVFELELDDEEGGCTRPNQLGTLHGADRLEALLEPRTGEEQTLLDNVQHICKDSTLASGSKPDLNGLALALQSLGYVVGIRKTVGGGVGGECLKNLRHSFLRCSMPGQERVYVVDPCFKDQFDVLHPTPEYLKLFEALPTSFVAPEERVAQVVNLLCTEMLQVFKHEGTTLPPWRKASSMITKWLPRKATDEILPFPGGIALKRPHWGDSDATDLTHRRRGTPFGGVRIKAVRNLRELVASEDEGSDDMEGI